MIVSFVPQVADFPTVLLADGRPLVGGDEGGGIHDSAIADDEATLRTRFGEREISVLDSQHRFDEVLLEVERRLRRQLGKFDSAAEEDVRRLGNAIHFPTQIFEKVANPVLTSGFTRAGSPG